MSERHDTMADTEVPLQFEIRSGPPISLFFSMLPGRRPVFRDCVHHQKSARAALGSRHPQSLDCLVR
jgi:hypothetical protein